MRFPQRRMDKITYLFLSIIISILCADLNAQTGEVKKERIDINNADDVYIERDSETGKDWHRLLGNVSLRHNDITMICDSAHFFPDKNTVNAFRNIHIEQGDTLSIFGDILTYNGISQLAEMTGNVQLINKETHLFTNHVFYNVDSKIAFYPDSGRIVNVDNMLKSKVGRYYASSEQFMFKDSVEITTPEYYITSDTMEYNTRSEIVYFYGPTDLTGDSLILHCEQGWYDTKNDITQIWRKASINNMVQFVSGDSINYNDITGYGEVFRNISIMDTTNKIMVKGNYAKVTKSPETLLVTDNALFIQFSQQDSLYLHADTLSSVMISDSLREYRLMRAYNNCKIFSLDLQAKCDSLSYSFLDSAIRLYTSPIIWSDANQLTSDSVALFTKNMSPDRLELYNSAFIINEVDTLRYNQIKGRMLTGYFENNQLTKININGNGETIYHIVDGDAVIGVNVSNSSTIDIILEKGDIKEIFQHEPGGDINPPIETADGEFRMENFEWFDYLRPKSIDDLFR